MDHHASPQKPSRFKTAQSASLAEVGKENFENNKNNERRWTKESLQFTDKQIEILSKR